MNIQKIRESVGSFGLEATAQDLAYRGANKLTEVTILKGVVLTMATVDPKFLTDDEGYRWGFLDRAAWRRASARGPRESHDEAFIDQALAKGDRCYGALDGDTIASYGWYSTRPTAVTAIADDTILHFDSAYAYMYRGYTLPAHRGKRLHGIGMARALQAHVEAGAKGLVSCVELNNFASLRSCQRLGYQSFGLLLCVAVAGRRLTFATKGCATYGFRVEARA